jgi:cell wall assembly regulator SMI1
MTQEEKIENTLNLLARLDGWLRTNRPEYYAKLLPGLSAAEVDDFEQKLGVQLPIEFKLFYQWKNGDTEQNAFIANYYLISLSDALDDFKMMNDMMRVGEFERDNWWNTLWIPFVRNWGGDTWCIDLAGSFDGVQGQIIQFWHDDEYREILCRSFYKWLETIVVAYESRKSWLSGEDDKYDTFKEFWKERNSGYPIEHEAG